MKNQSNDESLQSMGEDDLSAVLESQSEGVGNRAQAIHMIDEPGNNRGDVDKKGEQFAEGPIENVEYEQSGSPFENVPRTSWDTPENEFSIGSESAGKDSNFGTISSFKSQQDVCVVSPVNKPGKLVQSKSKDLKMDESGDVSSTEKNFKKSKKLLFPFWPLKPKSHK